MGWVHHSLDVAVAGQATHACQVAGQATHACQGRQRTCVRAGNARVSGVRVRA